MNKLIFRRFIPGYRLQKEPISFFLLSIVTISILSLFGVTDSNAESEYLDYLIDTANEQRLYDDKYWHILLHYRKTLSGTESLIDDPQFFCSSDGKYNPQKELEATLSIFFQGEYNNEKSPRCRFIARYSWLKEKLDIDDSKITACECKKFDEIYKKISPQSVSLIFPSAYINNPASMFGHTFINIETESKIKLSSYAVNYSAFAQEANGLSFAFKGLFGFYKGYFSVLPYYKKVNEYNNIDQRDIWEYQLNFNEEEIKKLFMHVWELQEIYSDYYFLDENCSYNILFLLEAARPSLILTDTFRWWVIPIDTIKKLDELGVVEEVYYRPSKATKVNYLASLLKKEEQKLALDIANEKAKPEIIIAKNISAEEKKTILDLSIEYCQFKYLNIKNEISKNHYADYTTKLLEIRSHLEKSNVNKDKMPVPQKPNSGHDTQRISVGFGHRKKNTFLEFRWRPAYHDLVDNNLNNDKGTQIQIFNTKLRHYFQDDRTKLEHLDLLDIISLPERNIILKPFSWKFKTGLRQEVMKDGNDHLIFSLNMGGGCTYKNELAGLYYSMIEGEINYGGSFHKKNYAIGIGTSLGMRRTINKFWRVFIYGRSLYFGLGDEYKTYKVSLLQGFTITSSININFEISKEKTYGLDRTEFILNWNKYF